MKSNQNEKVAQVVDFVEKQMFYLKTSERIDKETYTAVMTNITNYVEKITTVMTKEEAIKKYSEKTGMPEFYIEAHYEEMKHYVNPGV